MIELPIDVRIEHLDRIKDFCSKNGIIWGQVNSESWLNGVTGTPEQVKMVKEYNEKLEKERFEYRRQKKKGFLYRLFN